MPARRKKIIALKFIAKDKDDGEESEEGDKDEDITIIIQKFRKFMKKKETKFQKVTLLKGQA